MIYYVTSIENHQSKQSAFRSIHYSFIPSFSHFLYHRIHVVSEKVESVSLDLQEQSCKLGQVVESLDGPHEKAPGTAERLVGARFSGGRAALAGKEPGLWTVGWTAGAEQQAWESEEEAGGSAASGAGAEAEAEAEAEAWAGAGAGAEAEAETGAEPSADFRDQQDSGFGCSKGVLLEISERASFCVLQQCSP